MSKRKLIIGMILVVIVTVCFSVLYFSSDLKELHRAEITKVIEEQNGELESIEEISNEKNPFLNESNKYNIIYKIVYKKDGKLLTAWYRGVKTINNIHDQTPSPQGGGFGEKWIFE